MPVHEFMQTTHLLHHIITGADMKATLEEYYQVLFQADPASIGGSMPYDAFYYGAE